MELQQLAYFRSAARLEHLTRAAEEHGIAQPSLSKSIQLLEEELGVELFDRLGRGVRLNDFGRAFLVHVETALQALEDGRRELTDLALAREETLAISAVALLWATGLFRAFSAQRSNVRLRLFQRLPAEMLSQLVKHEIDLCLIPDPEDNLFEWTPLVSGEIWVMVAPGHRLEGRKTVALAELRGEPLILPRAGGPLRVIIEMLYRRSRMDLDIVCESDDVSAMRGLVLAGLGIQFVPDFRHALEAEDDPLYMRLIEPDYTIHLGLAWLRSGYHTQAARDFVDFAVEFIRSGRPIPRA